MRRIAYAPCCHLEQRLGAHSVSILSDAVPEFHAFLTSGSPDTDVAKLTCPVFLFHADDDSNVPTEDVASFAQVLQSTDSKVNFVRVQTGDHYDSMIREGIPKAIDWLQTLPH